MKFSGYVPFYNNAGTVLEAVRSLQQQSLPLDEVFAVDDGSTDGGAEVLEREGVEVIRLGSNRGRGAARATAMERAKGELVVCCDATNVLDRGFVGHAIIHFENTAVASVFGTLKGKDQTTARGRWRSRYLFREGLIQSKRSDAGLITYGAMVRASYVKSIGGYAKAMRHTEDADLGQRLMRAGFQTLFDPALIAWANTENTLGQLLERYWRWNVGAKERVSLTGYLRQVWFCTRYMAFQDLMRKDFGSAVISLVAPCYSLMKSMSKK